jgi:hypothetical protein
MFFKHTSPLALWTIAVSNKLVSAPLLTPCIQQLSQMRSKLVHPSSEWPPPKTLKTAILLTGRADWWGVVGGTKLYLIHRRIVPWEKYGWRRLQRRGCSSGPIGGRILGQGSQGCVDSTEVRPHLSQMGIRRHLCGNWSWQQRRLDFWLRLSVTIQLYWNTR